MARRGRPPNTLTEGSANHQLSKLAIGERLYVETSIETYNRDRRFWTLNHAQRTAAIKKMKFSVSLFTAVSATKVEDLRYILCIERLA